VLYALERLESLRRVLLCMLEVYEIGFCFHVAVFSLQSTTPCWFYACA
jgi:hypothetical protein